MAIIIKTGKSNTEDAKTDGDYLFFDRSQIVKKSNKYLFEGEYTIVPGEGNFEPKYYKGKFDLHQRAYCLRSDNLSIITKYLFWFLRKNQNIFSKYSVGSTVPSLRLSSFDWIIHKKDWPSLIEQQNIIDIIEPKEDLFLKYSKCVRIDSLENAKTDIQNIIDIIEPIENLISTINCWKTKINFLSKDHYANRLKYNSQLIDHVNFVKGKSLSSNEFKTFGTPFLDVKSLLGSITKYVDVPPNTFYGDILLSLDGTPGRVSYANEGYNGYVYNLQSNVISKGQIYIDLIAKVNQDIIQMCSKGTTIKHASSAKEKMIHLKSDPYVCDTFLESLILISKITGKLEQLKTSLINLLVK
ncbi:restriction endonuclease subunit S [Williamsoniiplasma lucivorax]|uniref:Type I restriction enzyme, S subunit n=1 Tax=Williamsoniiplasma lucivorax TaxID=209274 RepID=A0A2S5RFL4_9MOLU|nr:restriction endonuclease subunit S [Williamsoniiplasma lucivorax]PPE06090.1 type I restriction enzyme, S subunit [Williamsoniiplasma lucivorax]